MMVRMMVRMMVGMMQEDHACSSLTVDIVGWAVQPGCRASNYDVDVLQEQCRARRSTKRTSIMISFTVLSMLSTLEPMSGHVE